VPDPRDRIIESSKPLLNRGEVVAHVVRALEGPNRWAGIGLAIFVGIGVGLLTGVPIVGLPVMWVVFTRLYGRRILLATDQAVVVVDGGHWRFEPKKVLERLDVDTPIGPLKGLFLSTHLNGRRLYVVPRSAREVVAADADLDT